MNRRDTLFALLAIGAVPLPAAGQQARVYRIGVIHHGGTYDSAVNGLRDGLKELGFEEGKHYILHLRDAKGDPRVVEGMAKGLEDEKVDLVYAVTTSVTTEAKRATKSVRIVFYVGSDPVVAGLVEQFRKPGGRLTGVFSRFTDLTGKRLELLQEISPKIRRVVTFYNPNAPTVNRSLTIGREAAQKLKLELIERTITSVDDLRAGLRALRPGEADAFSYMSDVTVISQADLVVEAARTNRMLAMFSDAAIVAKGGLASYGQSYHTIGRLCARFVHRVLLGAEPKDLPVEQLDRVHFAINLRTAKALGITVPPSILTRADEVIR